MKVILNLCLGPICPLGPGWGSNGDNNNLNSFPLHFIYINSQFGSVHEADYLDVIGTNYNWNFQDLLYNYDHLFT